MEAGYTRLALIKGRGNKLSLSSAGQQTGRASKSFRGVGVKQGLKSSQNSRLHLEEYVFAYIFFFFVLWLHMEPLAPGLHWRSEANFSEPILFFHLVSLCFVLCLSCFCPALSCRQTGSWPGRVFYLCLLANHGLTGAGHHPCPFLQIQGIGLSSLGLHTKHSSSLSRHWLLICLLKSFS